MPEIYDVVVVGAGPSGSTVAWFLAKKGFRVCLVEEHAEVGVPVHCAGLVSKRLSEKVEIPRKSVVNELREVKLHLPGGASISLPLGEDSLYVLDREEFDKCLAEKALEAGSEIVTRCKARKILFNGDSVEVIVSSPTLSGGIKSKVVVEADGVKASIRRVLNLNRPSPAIPAVQYVLTGVELEREDLCNIYVGGEIAPGAYAWLFSCGNGRVKVGLGVRAKGVRALERLEWFIKKCPLTREIFKEAKPIALQSGAVPISGLVKPLTFKRCVTVGDAAGQVNPLTGGGIRCGIECALIAGEAIARSLSAGEITLLREYESRVLKTIGEIFSSLITIRGFLEKLPREASTKLAQIVEGGEHVKISFKKVISALVDIGVKPGELLKILPTLKKVWRKDLLLL